MSNKVYWLSPVPSNCQTCAAGIGEVFFDAKTQFGPWACLCPTCQEFGPGLGQVGTGRGQKYEKQKDGKWLKTEG